MGKFIKPDWAHEGPEGPMVWEGAFSYHLTDEGKIRAVLRTLTGAHTLTVMSETKPANGIVEGSWAYRSHNAWRHEVAHELMRNGIVVSADPADVGKGVVFLAKQGQRKPAA